jgi:hypothetical protein
MYSRAAPSISDATVSCARYSACEEERYSLRAAVAKSTSLARQAVVAAAFAIFADAAGCDTRGEDRDNRERCEAHDARQ